MAVGIAVPPLAQLGQCMLLPSIVLLLVTSVVLAEPGPLRGTELLRPLAMVAANLLLAVALAAMPAPLPGLVGSWPWFVLVAAAPPAGSAALIAAMLGLPVRPLLFAQIAGFLVLPLTAPLVMGLLFSDLSVDAGALAVRVALLLCLPCFAGPAIRRWLGPSRRHDLAPQIRGVGALSLIGIGLGTAAGLTAPHPTANMAEIAFGLGIVLILGIGVGALVGRGAAPGAGAGLMIAGGVRNLTVLWGACIGLAPPEAALVLQLGTVVTLVAPALLGLACHMARRRPAAAPVLRLPGRPLSMQEEAGEAAVMAELKAVLPIVEGSGPMVPSRAAPS
jgi:hypothetical protein